MIIKISNTLLVDSLEIKAIVAGSEIDLNNPDNELGLLRIFLKDQTDFTVKFSCLEEAKQRLLEICEECQILNIKGERI